MNKYGILLSGIIAGITLSTAFSAMILKDKGITCSIDNVIVTNVKVKDLQVGNTFTLDSVKNHTYYISRIK